MKDEDIDHLVYNWNQIEQIAAVEVFDETLRDGLQSPSVRDPSIEQKCDILRLLNQVGVKGLNVGLPAASERQAQGALKLVTTIREEKLNIIPACAARTLVSDIAAVAHISQKTGVAIEVYTFIGSSPIRFFTEDWTLDNVLSQVHEAVSFAVREGLRCCLVTEDTTRSNPQTLKTIFDEALACGASALCLCDTVGYADPSGVKRLVQFVKQYLAENQAKDIRLDWHGHNDRGLALANALMAAEQGVQRIQGSLLGLGERVGNTALEQLIINLQLRGQFSGDTRYLQELCDLVAEHTGFQVPANQPLIGKDAFRTTAGVHAAAIAKAMHKQKPALADSVYSSVKASSLGREQQIDIGNMSGMSNVAYWFSQHSMPFNEPLAKRILSAAKQAEITLTDADIWAIVRSEP